MKLFPLLILIASQVIFTTSDFMGRKYMTQGFTFSNFTSPWFVFYFTIRIFATFGQLYLFTQSGLGRTITLFGVAGLLFANTIGFVVFKEVLSPLGYVGIALAAISFLLVAFS